MIRIRQTSTGETQNVEKFDQERYPGWVQDGPALPAGGEPSVLKLNSGVWGEDPARAQAEVIALVKTEAERRKMLVRSPGSGKGSEYRQKKTEGLAASSVTAAVLNALSKPLALQQYPAAALESELTGEPIASILSAYLARSTASDMEVLRLSAIERDAVVRIKAATTAAAKRAVYAAISWTWRS